MNSKTGWTLVIAGIALLAANGRLDLLVVLLPAAVVLAYSLSWLSRGHRA